MVPHRYEPPLPSTVVTDFHRNHHPIHPHAISPIKSGGCSTDDSGYLGQVHEPYVDYGMRRRSRSEKNIRAYHTQAEGISPTSAKQPRNYKKKKSPKNNRTLSWRMDPSESFSDFKLVIIGVNNHKSKNKHGPKLTSSKQKRRQKWNVEGLFLDMSESEDDRDDSDNNMDREECRGHEHRVSKYNYQLRREYNLHKVNLAVGQRSCEYFTKLFQRQQRSGAKNADDSQHSMELPISCLDAIPIMLDYIYATPSCDQVQASTDTAVSLRHLATMFGNRSLYDSVTDFIRNDLRPETAITYLLEADLHRQKKLRNVCIQICAEEFDNMKIRQLAIIPPYLFESILYSSYFNCSDTYAVCSTIAAYCRCRDQDINGSMLLALTDRSIMPEIYPKEALFFIKTMLSMGMNLEDDVGQDQRQYRVRELYERCIGASPSIVHEVLDSLCNSHGKDVNIDDGVVMSNVRTRQNKLVCADYRQLPPQVKVDLLEYALAKHQSSVAYGSI